MGDNILNETIKGMTVEELMAVGRDVDRLRSKGTKEGRYYITTHDTVDIQEDK